MGCGQTGDGHPEWGAAHVVETELMAEMHRLGIATVLTADADLHAGSGLATTGDGDLDEAANAVTIQRLERIDREGRPDRRIG